MPPEDLTAEELEKIEKGKEAAGREDALSSVRLTAGEREASNRLADAWNAFAALPDKRPNDSEDMADALNRAHDLIALRVARRVDPDFWR